MIFLPFACTNDIGAGFISLPLSLAHRPNLLFSSCKVCLCLQVLFVYFISPVHLSLARASYLQSQFRLPWSVRVSSSRRLTLLFSSPFLFALSLSLSLSACSHWPVRAERQICQSTDAYNVCLTSLSLYTLRMHFVYLSSLESCTWLICQCYFSWIVDALLRVHLYFSLLSVCPLSTLSTWTSVMLCVWV